MTEMSKQSFHDADCNDRHEATDMENIIGFEALFRSMLKCRCGVMWKDSTASFVLNGLDRVLTLSRQLHSGAYKAKPVIHFRITSPKPRDIASISFRDRVFQRSLNDNYIYPVMVKSFIRDNYACQKGKGTDAARNRLKQFLHEYYRKHGSTGYVAQFDIHGYYPNMNHAMTEALFRKKLHPDVFAFTERILHEQYEGDCGYNPGSQLIQIAGISVLDELDHFIKEKLRVRCYLRYMDDFLIIHEDKAFLEYCRICIEQQLVLKKFELNPKKSRIFTLAKGIEFLGFVFSLTSTGRVLMQIRPDNVKRQRKKLYRLVRKSLRDNIPRRKIDESYAAWRNHASKGNSYKLLQRMDAFYQSLWR